MLKLTTSTPCEWQGTIEGPKPNGLGPYWDKNGTKWDIYGYGMDEEGWWCWATRDIHPYYTDTSTARYGFVQQRWLPYRMEIIDVSHA